MLLSAVTNRLPLLLAILVLMIFVVAGAKAANDDVQFDPQMQVRARILEEAVGNTRVCIHNLILGYLRQGMRSREQLIINATAICRIGLDQVATGLGMKDITDAGIGLIGDQELNVILKYGR